MVVLVAEVLLVELVAQVTLHQLLCLREIMVVQVGRGQITVAQEAEELEVLALMAVLILAAQAELGLHLLLVALVLLMQEAVVGAVVLVHHQFLDLVVLAAEAMVVIVQLQRKTELQTLVVAAAVVVSQAIKLAALAAQVLLFLDYIRKVNDE
jgi:hypothetical protein